MPPETQLVFPFAAEDDRRMMPTDFIGAALFSALNRSAKPIYLNKLTELARVDGYRLVYRGRVLTQAHADVWLAIIELFRRRGTAVDGVAEFRAGEMIRILDREPSPESRIALYEWVSDMVGCNVHLYEPGTSQVWLGGLLAGSMSGPQLAMRDARPLLDRVAVGEIQYKLVLHPQLRDAFDRGYTGIDWAHRRSIGKSELALWLHHYLAAFPKPVAIDQLHALSWQRYGEPNDPKLAAQARASFRYRLKKAIRKLTELKLIRRWKVDDNDRLCVVLPPQPRPARARLSP